MVKKLRIPRLGEIFTILIRKIVQALICIVVPLDHISARLKFVATNLQLTHDSEIKIRTEIYFYLPWTTMGPDFSACL